MMSAWNGYWHGPSSAARGTLLHRVVLLLLGFDCWVDLAAHGARYGHGGFNVAHFAWLDAIQPVPAAGFYVGLVLFSGWLSLTMAFAGPTRAGSVVLFLAYTYAWMMSLLDSYQHYYLLSLMLCLFVFFPAAWARQLMFVTCGIVYAYTGVTKTEAAWRSGAALQDIALEGMKPFVGVASRMGIEPDVFWPFVGHSVILLQFAVAVGYALAPLRDRGARWINVASALAWAAATAFHVGAEIIELKIGWFSYYMLLVPLAAWAPARWIEGTLAMVRRCVAPVGRVMDDAATGGTTTALVLAVVVALLVAGMGHGVDLPGGLGAGVALGVLLVVWTGLQLRGRNLRAAWVSNTAALGAGLLLWLGLGQAETRYDFYRFAGGAHEKAGHVEEALAAYRKAERYAPEGESRRQKIEKLEERLGKGSPR